MSKFRWIVLVLPLVVSNAAGAAEPFSATLRSDRAEVTALYGRLVNMSSADFKLNYQGLPPSVQEDLWSIRLERFVASHPELSPEQRAVIYEGVGLLSLGIIEAASEDGQAAVAAHEAVNRLEYRARTTLGVGLAREAFATFDDVLPDAVASADASRKVSSNYSKNPVCSCSGDSNWCDTITNPTPKCRPDPCIITDGCGTLFLYTCNGICGPGAPNP